MKYETPKTASAVKLDGIKVDFEMIDKVLKTVTLTDSSGNTLRILAGAYDGVKLAVPATPTLEERFVLVGSTPVGPIREVFGYEHEALARSHKLEAMFRSDVGVELSIKSVNLPVDDEGQVKAEDIPF